MSAETEQYRDELEQVAYDAYMISADHAPDRSPLWDATEAVAAQVLRDFKAFIEWRANRNILDPTQDLRCIGHLEAFAREHGIDLNGGER